MEERRYKLLTLTEREVLLSTIPHPAKQKTGLVFRKTILPDGYEIRGVHYEFRYRAFVFVIYHPSFKIISDGSEIPEMNHGEMWTQIFTVKK